MTTVGIVAEYNPLHLGHLKQFRMVRDRFGPDTAILCIQSGNYVQRGEPAVFDKFTRARAAVLCGADLVVELPLTRAISSAEGFAFGAVQTLDRLGVVDALCFGSECADGARLQSVAQRLLQPDFDAALKDELARGGSYAAAREAALRALGGDADVLRRPNDILGVEYCKALLSLASAIAPVAVRRGGDYHAAQAERENPSATAVRALLAGNGAWRGFVPEVAAQVFETAQRHELCYGERAMLARLRALTDAEFAQLPFGGEGLWSKVMKACRREGSVAAILESAKSKRYAHARLKRLLLCGYLGITREMLEKEPGFVRALAFTERGAGLLRRARNACAITILNAGEANPDTQYDALERRAADLYALFACDETQMYAGTERAGRIFLVK